MSTQTVEDHFKLDNSKLWWGLEEELPWFRDESTINFSKAHLSQKAAMIATGHQPQKIPPKVKFVCVYVNCSKWAEVGNENDESSNDNEKDKDSLLSSML